MPTSTADGISTAPSDSVASPEMPEPALLLAGVAHDLRTPLTAIRAHSQALARRSRSGFAMSPQDLREQLTAIDDAVGEIDALVDDMLDLARSGAGRIPDAQRRSTDLLSVVRAAVDRLERSDPGRRIAVLAPDAALIGDWDPHQLGRLVTNLLTNACAFSPAARPITVRLTRAPLDGRSGVVLSVEDQGCGIPPQELQRLFTPFVRGSNATGAGTGLGLSIARWIAERHGGRITIASAEGAGTAVTAWLPLAAPAAASVPIADAAAPGH